MFVYDTRLFVQRACIYRIKTIKTSVSVYGAATNPPLKASRVVAVARCSGRIFHSLIPEGKKECWYMAILQNGTKYFS